MGETLAYKSLRAANANSLLMLGGVYRRREGRVVEYRGERPGSHWHRHGHLARWLWVVEDGRRVRYQLLKQRWIDPRTGRTRHSRPPDDLGFIQSCTLAVVLALWAWLDASGGLLSREDLVESAHGSPSSRTVQRWLRRALPNAMATQQALRLAVIERSEPRPVERLFRGGLSPPESLRRRRWKSPTAVSTLWTGIAIALIGAIELDIATPHLLAEARGRRPMTNEPFLI
jgi:hypothetical protein